MNETTAPMTGRYFSGKPVSYHRALDQTYDAWASECGRDPKSLRDATEQAICTRHHEAIIDDECHKARRNQPDIFTLSLGSLQVFYTVEPCEILVRGYGWDIDREPLDDFDGGGFYAEASW